MKKKVIISFLALLVLLVPINIYAQESNIQFEYNQGEQKKLSDAPEVGCKAAYVANPATGKVFYEKNAHERMYPASTTKILTALVVIENCNLNDTTIVSQNAVDTVTEGYADADLQVGEELRLKDLLYALLIPSANEAANVLAEYVSGSISEFANLCNQRAKELGCEDLHFTNPSGMHDDDHYCTAYDLYIIAKECQKHDIFNQIVQTRNFTLPATEIYPHSDRTFENSNSLIQPTSWEYYYAYCTGIKTGYTTPAGECLVASSSHDNIDLISVVLGGDINSLGLSDRFYDTKQLLEFVYNNYSFKEIVKEGTILTTISVSNATKETSLLDIVASTSIYAIVPNSFDLNQIPTYINLPDKVIAPVQKSQVMAQAIYKVDGLNFKIDIVASHRVNRIPFWIHNTIVVCIILFIISLTVLIILYIINHRNKPTNDIEVVDFIDEKIE